MTGSPVSSPMDVHILLQNAIRRVRRLALVRGAAAVGIVWLLGIVAVMAVDARLVLFDDRIRWAMSAGVWTLAAVTALVAILLPLRRRTDFRRMAQILDARHPEHEERLSSFVELAERNAGQAGFSQSLFALVCELAEGDAGCLDLRREFPVLGTLVRFLVFAAFALALGLGVILSPHLVGRLFIRAVAPWVDVGNLYANDIIVKPGDMVALAGTVIRIEATVDPALHAEPVIRISRRQGLVWGEEVPEPMTGGRYETTADSSDAEWRYRVNAGPAVTRYYHVRVSERPKYDSFVATVEYPAYTGFRPSVFSNAQVSAIRAIEGSRVKFDLKVTEEGTVAEFRIGGEPLTEHVMVSNRTVNWSLELVNRDGFRSPIGRHPLRSVLDQPPAIVIESPSEKLPPLPPHAKVPIEFTASDDVKVLRPDVIYSLDGGEMHDLGEVDAFNRVGGRLYRGKTEVDLSRFDLSGVKKIGLGLVARDNRPAEFGGCHAVTSSIVEVTLEAGGWSLGVADLQQQAKKANALLDEAKKRMRDAERTANDLKRTIPDELSRNGKPSEQTERRTESAAHEIEEAKKRLDELKERFQDDERLRPLTEPVAKTVDEHLQPALDKAGVAPFQEPRERAATMEQMAKDLHAAIESADRLSRQIKERVEKVDAFEKSKDLAARQADLARSLENIVGGEKIDASRLEAWKRLEEDAARRAAEIKKALHHQGEMHAAHGRMDAARRKAEELKNALAATQRAAAAKQSTERLKQQEERLQQQSVNEAKEAAKVLEREVASQSTALGLSRKDSAQGGADDEVDKLAKELHRNDSPDFFKKIFSRLGWFRIRGSVRDGVGEQDLKDVPAEYRDLVRRYFLKLAEENP